MRIDLLDLFDTREIVNPSTIAKIELEAGSIKATVFGYPWWRSPKGRPNEGTLTMTFQGIEYALIDHGTLIYDFEDHLDIFWGGSWNALPWRQGASGSIYCNRPIPDPVAVFVAVENYLSEQTCPFGPEEFLHSYGGDGFLTSFKNLVESPGYYLGGGPAPICHLICAELDRQGVTYKLHGATGENDDPELQYFSLTGQTFIVCEKAFAEFDD